MFPLQLLYSVGAYWVAYTKSIDMSLLFDTLVMTLGTAALAIGVAYVWTFRRSSRIQPEQILADGGRYVELRDGRVAEYFDFGSSGLRGGEPSSQQVLLLFHGYTLSGAAAESWHEECLRRGIRVIGVSMAGWGGSSPQHGRSYMDAGHDALRVLEHAGVSDTQRLHVVGISFGAGNAAAFAALCPPGRVRSLSLIVPAWPSMRSHNMWSGTPFVHWLTGQPVCDRLWQYYIAPRLDIPSLLQQLAPQDWAEFVAKQGATAAQGMALQLQRSTRYYHEGACDGTRLLRSGGPALLAAGLPAWLALGRRVSVWYAKNDQLAPAHHGIFLARLLPDARVFAQDCGHLGMFASLAPFLDEMETNP